MELKDCFIFREETKKSLKYEITSFLEDCFVSVKNLKQLSLKDKKIVIKH